MAKTFLLLALLLVLALGGFLLLSRISIVPDRGDSPGGFAPVACTADAKICDDGTAVGRDPLNGCEFHACPDGATGGTDREAPTFCTKELRSCPEGDGVGRDSDRHCAFAPCAGEGTVAGDVTLEKSCGYDRVFDKPCPTEPYDGALSLSPSAGGTIVWVEVYGGAFHATLPAGTYEVSTGRALPRCDGSFTVRAGEATDFSVVCQGSYR